MHLFLFLALPTAALAYCFACYQRPSRFFAPAAIGATMGALLCIVKEFFVFSPPPPQAAFAPQFTWAVCEFSLPALLVALLWQLLSRSDKTFKAKALVPLLAFLCCPLVVREAFATGEENSFFMLFLHPVLAVCALFLAHSCVVLCGSQARQKHTAACALSVCLTALSLCIPAAVFALWRLKIAGQFYLWLSVAFAILSLVAFFSQPKSEDKLVANVPPSKETPPSPSPWGWDMKSPKEMVNTVAVSANDVKSHVDSTQLNDTPPSVMAAQGRQNTAAGGSPVRKRRGGKRARRGKNTARRKRKR